MSERDVGQQQTDDLYGGAETKPLASFALDGLLTTICVIGFIIAGILYAIFG